MAKMVDKVTADAVIMVSPPAAMLEFESDKSISNLKLVTTGSRDEFAPPDLIKKLLQTWNPTAAFEIIPDADHFFFGYTELLLGIVSKNL